MRLSSAEESTKSVPSRFGWQPASAAGTLSAEQAQALDEATLRQLDLRLALDPLACALLGQSAADRTVAKRFGMQLVDA